MNLENRKIKFDMPKAVFLGLSLIAAALFFGPNYVKDANALNTYIYSEDKRWSASRYNSDYCYVTNNKYKLKHGGKARKLMCNWTSKVWK